MVMAPRPMRETTRPPRCAVCMSAPVGGWVGDADVVRPARKAADEKLWQSLSWGPLRGTPNPGLGSPTVDDVTAPDPRPRDAVRAEIREFLSTRRARITPEQAG